MSPLRLYISGVTLYLLATAAVGQQLPKTNVTFLNTWDPCQGFNSDPAMSGPPTQTVLFASFNDPLPDGAILRSVVVRWGLGSGRQFSWQGIPSVSVSIGQTAAGPSLNVTNYGKCGQGTLLQYDFQSADFPAGWPGYVYRGTNNLFLTIAGGLLYPGAAYPTLELTYQLPDPITFDITGREPENDRRVLISNLEPRSQYPYPRFQALSNTDAEVPFFMKTRNANGQIQGGLTVYMRVVDPPDTAPYMNVPGSVFAHPGDNTGGAATITGVTASGTPGVYQAVSDANGQISARLQLNAAHAGDNYQIEATYNPTFPALPGESWKSGTLTAWKRLFVEKKPMFRRGAPLATEAPAGVTNIIVESGAISSSTPADYFQAQDSILLLHAPPFGQPKTGGGSGAFYQGSYRIVAVNQFTADGPQPGPRNSSITTNGTTTVAGQGARFDRLFSGDVIGIGGEFRYIISTQGANTAVIDRPFTFSGRTTTYTIGDPNLLDLRRNHYQRITLDHALLESYGREPLIPPSATSPISLTLNDAAVKLSATSPAPSDYFTAPPDDLLIGAANTQPDRAFPSAFTEYVVLPWQSTLPGAILPRVRLLSNLEYQTELMQMFMDKWFELPTPAAVPPNDSFYRAAIPRTWFRYSTTPNHQLLLIADTDSLLVTDGKANGALVQRPTGVDTTTTPNRPIREMGSMIWRGNTEALTRNSQTAEYNYQNAPNFVDTILRRTVVHELTHQWGANGANNDHCYPRVAYTSTPSYPPTTATPTTPQQGLEFCLMAYSEGSEDGSGNTPMPLMKAPWDGHNINMIQYYYSFGQSHFHKPSSATSNDSEYSKIRQTSDPWKP